MKLLTQHCHQSPPFWVPKPSVLVPNRLVLVPRWLVLLHGALHLFAIVLQQLQVQGSALQVACTVPLRRQPWVLLWVLH